MKWDMWYAHVDGYVHKVGTSKDDLIEWLMGGHTVDNYAWGATKMEAIRNAVEVFGVDWYVEYIESGKV